MNSDDVREKRTKEGMRYMRLQFVERGESERERDGTGTNKV